MSSSHLHRLTRITNQPSLSSLVKHMKLSHQRVPCLLRKVLGTQDWLTCTADRTVVQSAPMQDRASPRIHVPQHGAVYGHNGYLRLHAVMPASVGEDHSAAGLASAYSSTMEINTSGMPRWFQSQLSLTVASSALAESWLDVEEPIEPEYSEPLLLLDLVSESRSDATSVSVTARAFRKCGISGLS